MITRVKLFNYLDRIVMNKNKIVRDRVNIILLHTLYY